MKEGMMGRIGMRFWRKGDKGPGFLRGIGRGYENGGMIFDILRCVEKKSESQRSR